VNIQPGFNGNAVYNQTRDGKLQPGLASLENAVFYNYALLPGWQKWMPTYRYGTITAISGDNCDVTLEAAVSSVLDKNGNGLDINAVTTLSNVPIDYMDCDGEVFEVGDVVLIKFDSVKADIKNAGNWAHATVIGFKDHPKYPENALLYTEVYDINWQQQGFVALDADLEPVLTLEATIAYPTAHVAEISNLGGSATVFESWGTPYLYDSWIDGDKKLWIFRVTTVEHDEAVSLLMIGSAVLEYSTLNVQYDSTYRQSIIVQTDIDDPEPPPPELIKANWPSRYESPNRTYNGIVISGFSPNAGWIDASHYIYAKEERVYDNTTALSQYTQKASLVINGVETLLYENHVTDDGYFYNMDGYTLTSSGGYSEGAAIFQDDTDYKYICSIAFNSYDPILVNTPFWEFFYYDGETLTRKTFTIDTSDGTLALLGNIDGTDIYTCGDITIK
jgi:hypothetical protein